MRAVLMRDVLMNVVVHYVRTAHVWEVLPQHKILVPVSAIRDSQGQLVIEVNLQNFNP